MEQLIAAFGIDWRLVLAQAINFGIVLVALRYFLYTPLMQMLDERQRKVAQGVTDAEIAARMRSEADATARDITREAEVTASQMVLRARTESDAERERIMFAAEAQAAALAKDIEARAAESALVMKREAERDIARLAVLAAKKTLEVS